MITLYARRRPSEEWSVWTRIKGDERDALNRQAKIIESLGWQWKLGGE